MYTLYILDFFKKIMDIQLNTLEFNGARPCLWMPLLYRCSWMDLEFWALVTELADAPNYLFDFYFETVLLVWVHCQCFELLLYRVVQFGYLYE
jgi:hypothetical protein